ncbi:MAG: alpha/beta hydrolase-fold protein [Myxococcota bacterium]
MNISRSTILLAVLLGACAASPPPTRTEPSAPHRPTGPLRSRAELEAELSRAAEGDVERVWRRLRSTGEFPIVIEDTAFFFHRSSAQKVEWRGEFSSWDPSWDARGHQVGNTDLWRYERPLLPGSRLDYKIVTDGEWQLDPHNSRQQVGGFGPNSEARMPPFEDSPYIFRTPDTPQGSFTANLPIESTALGYTVNVRIYLPPGLAPDARDLPVLFVTDGSDYYRDEMGATVIILDRLYQEEMIEPVVVVFVDPWDPEGKKNRRETELIPEGPGRCRFCSFLVDELGPWVSERYPVTADPARRAIVGTSLGGLFTTYVGLYHPDHFGLIGIQSPAYHVYSARFIFTALLDADAFPPKAFLDVGLYERRYTRNSQRAAKRLEELGTELLYIEAPQGHSWGHWRHYMDDMLIHFFGR